MGLTDRDGLTDGDARCCRNAKFRLRARPFSMQSPASPPMAGKNAAEIRKQPGTSACSCGCGALAGRSSTAGAALARCVCLGEDLVVGTAGDAAGRGLAAAAAAAASGCCGGGAGRAGGAFRSGSGATSSCSSPCLGLTFQALFCLIVLKALPFFGVAPLP